MEGDSLLLMSLFSCAAQQRENANLEVKITPTVRQNPYALSPPSIKYWVKGKIGIRTSNGSNIKL
jgi:hypothetical protein